MKSSNKINALLLSVLVFFCIIPAGGCDDDPTWDKVDTSKGEVIKTIFILELLKPFYVGGTVTGLNGTLVLQNNGADNLTILGDGTDRTFQFHTGLLRNHDYDVTVFSEPADQECTVSNGSGTIVDTNVTDVSVECITP